MNKIESLEELPPSLANAVIKEINTVRDAEAALAIKEQAEVAKELGEQKALDDLGRVRLQVHPTIYHHFSDKYGPECWNDTEFLRDFEKSFPECRVKSGGTRFQVGYTGNHRRRFKKTYADS